MGEGSGGKEKATNGRERKSAEEIHTPSPLSYCRPSLGGPARSVRWYWLPLELSVSRK